MELYLFSQLKNIFLVITYFLITFAIWGIIFLKYQKIIFPFLFLILKSIYKNKSIFIFIFSILLLCFEKIYINKELLFVYLSIITFFPVFKKSNNEEYIKTTIILICLSVFMFIDFFTLKSVNLTFQYIIKNEKENTLFYLISFFKTFGHSSFYVVFLSCFYIMINDYFYKDKNFSFKSLFVDFLKEYIKND